MGRAILFPLLLFSAGVVSCNNNPSSDDVTAELDQADAQSSISWGLLGNQSRETEALARIRVGGLANILPRLCSNKRLVLAGVRRNGLDLALASRELQNDHEVVLAAVRQNGLALQYASRELRGDPEIVLAAVRQNGLAIRSALNSLVQTDCYKEIALAAVQNNWKSLDYINDYYRGDYDIALAAINQDANAIYLISSTLFSNQDFVRHCYEISFGAYYYIYQSMLQLAITSRLPEDLNRNLGGMLADLSRLNIEFIERFNSATPAEAAEIVNNRMIIDRGEAWPDNRPIALVVLPKIDRSGSFIHNNMVELIRRGYQVVYFEAESDLEVYEAIELTGQRQPISLLYLGGHGTPETTRLSGQPYEDDEILFLDPSDETEMDYLNAYLAEDGQILLYSCRSCEGDLHLMLERVFPGRTLFIPDGTPQGFEFIFDSQNQVIEVVFN